MKSIKKYFAVVGLIAVLTAALFLLNVFSFTEITNAQIKPEKQQWETVVIRGGAQPEGLQGVINIRGEEGWELVQVVQSKDGNYVAFLKRRK